MLSFPLTLKNGLVEIERCTGDFVRTKTKMEVVNGNLPVILILLGCFRKKKSRILPLFSENNAFFENQSSRAFYKKITFFPDFGDAMSLKILSTFDSRCFRGI